MKKLFLFLLLLPLNLLAQNTIVDSMFTTHCITNSSMGETFNSTFIDSITSIYNSDGQLITRVSTVTSLRDGVVTYANTDVDSLIYDSVANSIETLSGTYVNSVLSPQRGKKIVYDVGGLMISQSLSPTYPDYTLTHYYFYLPNNLLDYFYTVTGPVGTNDSIFTDLTYDSLWNKIIEESFYWENGAILRPYEKLLQYFNGSQLLGYNWYLWVDSTIGYDPCYTDTSTFTYFPNGLLSTQTQHSCGSGYVTTWYSYDVNGNLDSTGFTGVTTTGDPFSRSCDAGVGEVINEIASISTKGQFILYPNPSNGRVELKGNFSSAIDEIRITDLSGRIVMTKKLIIKTESSFEFDLSDLSSGVYVMQVFDEGVRSVLFVRE